MRLRKPFIFKVFEKGIYKDINQVNLDKTHSKYGYWGVLERFEEWLIRHDLMNEIKVKEYRA